MRPSLVRVVRAGAAALLLVSALLAVDRNNAAGLREVARDGSLVAFPEPTLGYFVTPGGVVRRSRDGGRTWRRVGLVRPLVAVDFVSQRYGFALTKGGDFLLTSDGGRTWHERRRFHPAPGEMSGAGPPMVVDFVDRLFGVVASGPTRIFRTRDGGHTWQRLPFACPHGDYLAGVAFGNRREGFAACGGQPATAQQFRGFHFTRDGGSHWRYGKSRISSGHVALVASPGPGVRYVYASRLGIYRLGDRRILLSTNDADSVLAMSWPTTRVGYALLLHGGLKRTVDGGRQWRRP